MMKNVPESTVYGDEVTVYEVTASGLGTHWASDLPNSNRFPVFCDTQGDKSFEHECIFPFAYKGVTYSGCTINLLS